MHAWHDGKNRRKERGERIMVHFECTLVLVGEIIEGNRY